MGVQRDGEAATSGNVRNAQHGQNRAGVEVDEVEFDEFDASHPIDPAVADERIEDEGDEIRSRIRARGHDVVEG